jgi:hypothetical protein
LVTPGRQDPFWYPTERVEIISTVSRCEASRTISSADNSAIPQRACLSDNDQMIKDVLALA